MTLEEFIKHYKAIKMVLEDEPLRLIFSYKGKTIMVKHYDFLLRQEYIVIVDDYATLCHSLDNVIKHLDSI